MGGGGGSGAPGRQRYLSEAGRRNPHILCHAGFQNILRSLYFLLIFFFQKKSRRMARQIVLQQCMSSSIDMLSCATDANAHESAKALSMRDNRSHDDILSQLDVLVTGARQLRDSFTVLSAVICLESMCPPSRGLSSVMHRIFRSASARRDIKFKAGKECRRPTNECSASLQRLLPWSISFHTPYQLLRSIEPITVCNEEPIIMRTSTAPNYIKD